MVLFGLVGVVGVGVGDDVVEVIVLLFDIFVFVGVGLVGGVVGVVLGILFVGG